MDQTDDEPFRYLSILLSLRKNTGIANADHAVSTEFEETSRPGGRRRPWGVVTHSAHGRVLLLISSHFYVSAVIFWTQELSSSGRRDI